MYDVIETGISKDHLIEVLKAVEEPIVLMGGWAVFFHVNEDMLCQVQVVLESSLDHIEKIRPTLLETQLPNSVGGT